MCQQSEARAELLDGAGELQVKGILYTTFKGHSPCSEPLEIQREFFSNIFIKKVNGESCIKTEIKRKIVHLLVCCMVTHFTVHTKLNFKWKKYSN